MFFSEPAPIYLSLGQLASAHRLILKSVLLHDYQIPKSQWLYHLPLELKQILSAMFFVGYKILQGTFPTLMPEKLVALLPKLPCFLPSLYYRFPPIDVFPPATKDDRQICNPNTLLIRELGHQ